MLIFLAGALANSLQANNGMQDGRDERSCCWSSCYECGCNPLYCGALDLQFQGGVAPIIWTDRGNFSFVECLGVPAANAIVPIFELPRFFSLFKVPWTVGGQVGYAVDDNIRVYLEFNYLQAKGKGNSSLSAASASSSQVFGTNPVVLTMHKYKLYDVYLGGRYYWDRWCDRVSFFAGAKVGLTYHKSINFDSTISGTTLTTDEHFFRKNTMVSGGLNFGLDFCFCGNWSLVLTGELVASCGPKGNSIAFGQPGACSTTPTLPAPGLENILIGSIGTELRFPITAAVRYSF